MSRPSCTALLTLSILILSNDLSAERPIDSDLARKITTVIDAKAIERVPPKYPINEARKGKEGWVVLSFIVEPDGSTSNVIIEDSSGSQDFEKASKRAIKKWAYEPAIENGEAIQQCKTTVQLDFKMFGDGQGVTRKFRGLYATFAAALNEKNETEIERLGKKLKNYDTYTHTESYFKYTLLAHYSEYRESELDELSYLNKAMRFSGASGYFDKLRDKNFQSVSAEGLRIKKGQDAEKTLAKRKKVYNEAMENKLYPTLHKKLVLELAQNQLSFANETVDNLLLLDVAKENRAVYRNQKNELTKIIASENNILVQGNLQEKEFWHHKLLRNDFSFTDIKGALTKIDLRCSNKRHVYSVNEQSQWSIPDAWKDCSIYVYGEDNASFTLIESNSSGLDEQAEQVEATGD